MYYPSVYAGALAEAICRMLETDAAVGEALNIAGEPGERSFWGYAPGHFAEQMRELPAWLR